MGGGGGWLTPTTLGLSDNVQFILNYEIKKMFIDLFGRRSKIFYIFKFNIYYIIFTDTLFVYQQEPKLRG